MTLFRPLCCLALTASTVLAQPPRPAPVGAKADYHVHIKGDLTLDEALRRSKELGITYGIAINGGLELPLKDDAGVEAFRANAAARRSTWRFQAEGREWVRLFSRRRWRSSTTSSPTR